MDYRDIMKMLSECEMGAMVLSEDCIVLEMNTYAKDLLIEGQDLIGEELPKRLHPLLLSPKEHQYARNTFDEYLVSAKCPEVDGLSDDKKMIVFKNATDSAWRDMLVGVINQMSEAVVLCDTKSKVVFMNDAAISLDSFIPQEIRGKNLDELYELPEGAELVIPKVIAEKRPLFNHNHDYKTRYGKEVTTHSNTYPIMQGGQLLGAVNVLEDLTKIDELSRQIVDLQEKLRKRRGTEDTKDSPLKAKYTFKDIVHVSPAMLRTIEKCKQTAKSDSSVLIYGETGTGKELFAQSIHNASRRAKGPFLAINCAAIPDTLLESLLFGTEKGAFTGADHRIGLFEQANNGTLLLDEINSMDIGLQSKLLRVLQEGKLRRVGGMKEIEINVRVLSNINIPPYQAIEEGKLRQDLFYRLGVVSINIPPLRERVEDINLLSKEFIMKFNKKFKRIISGIDDDTLELFKSYNWPGNVRELQHSIEHAMNVMPDHLSLISIDYVPEHLTKNTKNVREKTPDKSKKNNDSSIKQSKEKKISIGESVKEMEYNMICEKLKNNHGNISRTAKELQISRQNLQYKIRRFGIDVTEYM